MTKRTVTRRGFLGAGAAGTAVVAAGLVASPAAAATRKAGASSVETSSVDTLAAPARQPRSQTLTAQALGVNLTGYDTHGLDPDVASRLADAHIGIVRYPGGSNADVTNWMDPTLGAPWPGFMQMLGQIDAAPLVTINYAQLSQGPESAAAWVASALSFPNYDSKTALWVMGNEGYGPWEFDQHPEPHTPRSFATNVGPYLEAIHRVDPAARVGVPVTISRDISAGTGTWVADPDLWNQTVIAANVDQLDFIDFHWYPVFGIPVLSNAELFAPLDRIPGAISYLRGILDEHHLDIPIVVSESNISQSEIVYNCQPVAALYAVATTLTFLASGVDSYFWWQVHNSDNMDGDFGFLSNGTGSPGPTTTTLTAPAAAGARTIQVADASGLHYAHQFTIDTGAAQESRKITALPGSTSLAAAAAAGDTTIHVTQTATLTTQGADTDYHQLFGPGTAVDVDGEAHTVATVGTAAVAGQLAAPASRGDTTLKIVGVGMGGQSIPVFMPTGFAPGGTVTVGTGADVETATIAKVGTASSLGTTLAAPAAAGDKTIYVTTVANNNIGVANYVGDSITIDTGAAEEVLTIGAVGVGTTTPTVTVAPVKAGDRTVYLASVTGLVVGHPLLLDTGSGLEVVSAIAAVGAQTATVLTADAAAGATSITVASSTNLQRGHLITIGTGASRETFTIQSLGRAGAYATVGLSAALAQSHAAGSPAVDVGSGVVLSSPAHAAHPAGVPAADLGTGITLTAPLQKAHPAGTATRDTGSGLTLAKPLGGGHPTGTTVTTPGTGITLTAPVSTAHPAGSTVTTSGVTVTPAFSRTHDAGASVEELGLKEPPLNTPLPAYWGFVLASHVATPGSQVISLAAPSAAVRAFVSYGPDTIAVCLVNTDDANSAQLRITGAGSSGTANTYAYSLENPAVTESTTKLSNLGSGITLDPESATVFTWTAQNPARDIALHA